MVDNLEVGQEPAPVDWLAIARECYRTATTYMDANLRPQWERNMRQWQGLHPNDSKYASDAWAKRSRLFRPKTRAAVRKGEAACATAFFSTQDVVSVRPYDDSDDMQRLQAEIMQGILNFRLEHTIPWFQILLGAYQEAQKTGVCISYQNWTNEQGKDQPYIELVPPENFRIDPAADWLNPIESSPYIIHLLPMYLCDVKKRMAKPARGQAQWLPLTDKELLSGSGQHGDSTRLMREGRRSDPLDQPPASDRYGIVWVRRYIVNQDGEDWIYYTVGDEHLLSEPVPLKSLYATGVRPYALGFCVLEAFKTFPAAPVELSKDIQEELNEITNQRIDNVKFVLNKRYFAKRGAQVDTRSLTRNVPGSVTLMNDPNVDVKIESTPDVTRSSFEEQDRLNVDFDEITGTFSNASVQSNRSLNETVGGLSLITDGANQVSEYQLRLFTETWVEPVLRQLVKLEQAYETDAVVLQYAGDQSDAFRSYGLTQVTDDLLQSDLTVRVNVGIGATNPHTQIQRFFFGMQSLAGVLGPDFAQRVDMQEVVKETFGKLGYKDGERFFTFNDEDPRIAQLQQQLQDLQQQLAQKRNPELDRAQIEKIAAETVKTNIESAYAAMQAAQVVATVPGSAPVGDSLLQSAGWVDKNGPPIMNPPQAPQAEVYAPEPGNTSPMSPPVPQQAEAEPQAVPTMPQPVPEQGPMAGIETQGMGV